MGCGCGRGNARCVETDGPSKAVDRHEYVPVSERIMGPLITELGNRQPRSFAISFVAPRTSYAHPSLSQHTVDDDYRD
jgi:hypothetical protein